MGRLYHIEAGNLLRLPAVPGISENEPQFLTGRKNSYGRDVIAYLFGREWYAWMDPRYKAHLIHRFEMSSESSYVEFPRGVKPAYSNRPNISQTLYRFKWETPEIQRGRNGEWKQHEYLATDIRIFDSLPFVPKGGKNWKKRKNITEARVAHFYLGLLIMDGMTESEMRFAFGRLLKAIGTVMHWKTKRLDIKVGKRWKRKRKQ